MGILNEISINHYIAIKKNARTLYGLYSSLPVKEQEDFLKPENILEYLSTGLESIETQILLTTLMIPDTFELLELSGDELLKRLTEIAAEKGLNEAVARARYEELTHFKTVELIDNGTLEPMYEDSPLNAESSVQDDEYERLKDVEYVKLKRDLYIKADFFRRLSMDDKWRLLRSIEIDQDGVFIHRDEETPVHRIISEYMRKTALKQDPTDVFNSERIMFGFANNSANMITLASLFVPNDGEFFETMQRNDRDMEKTAAEYQIPIGLAQFKAGEIKRQNTVELETSGILKPVYKGNKWFEAAQIKSTTIDSPEITEVKSYIEDVSFRQIQGILEKAFPPKSEVKTV